MTRPNFYTWLEAVVDQRYNGVWTPLAQALGMTLGGLRRGALNGTLSLENLLRLSALIGHNPSEVLRLANKAEWADLIERLFGDGRPDWRADVDAVCVLLQSYPPAYVEALQTMLSITLGTWPAGYTVHAPVEDRQ